MYHIVYLTTNLVNGKMYVGKQSTFNPYDNYIGSGHNIKRAIKKYGKDNFKKTILHFCLSKEDSAYWESVIVDQSFIDRKDTYNIAKGGNGGNTIAGYTPEQKIEYNNKLRLSNLGKKHNVKFSDSEITRRKIYASNKRNSDETKRKMSEVKLRNKTNAHKWVLITPEHNMIKIHGGLLRFLKSNNINIDVSSLMYYKNKNKSFRGWYLFNYKSEDEIEQIITNLPIEIGNQP